jgi:antirestriction protein
VTLDYSSFVDELCSLHNNFNEICQEFNSQEASLRLFSTHSNNEVDNVPEKFQMELLEPQGTDTSKHNSPRIFFTSLL